MKPFTPFVLDCSVTMTWCFKEEATTQTLNIRDSLLHTSCFVPSIWPLEVNNVLWSSVRSKKNNVITSEKL